jgi:hypothetical protein
MYHEAVRYLSGECFINHIFTQKNAKVVSYGLFLSSDPPYYIMLPNQERKTTHKIKGLCV